MKRKKGVRSTRITPEAVATYRTARQLHDNADIERWEEDGGHRREFLDACVKLHAMLSRHPWQADVIDTLDFEPPSNRQERKDWNVACALLAQLEEVVSAI